METNLPPIKDQTHNNYKLYNRVQDKTTIYTHVLVDLAYKLTLIFVVHFQVFKVFYNLANPAFLSMFYVVMSDKLLIGGVFTSLAVCADQPNIKMPEYLETKFSLHAH